MTAKQLNNDLFCSGVGASAVGSYPAGFGIGRTLKADPVLPTPVS